MGAAPILTILKNGETIRSVSLEGEAMLGREEGCVIRLEDRAISRQHAVFRAVGNSVQVEKRSEYAPLLVNGADCTSAMLKEGDVISIGPYLMRLSLEKKAAAAASEKPQEKAPVEAVAPIEMKPKANKQEMEAAPESELQDDLVLSTNTGEEEHRNLSDDNNGGGQLLDLQSDSVETPDLEISKSIIAMTEPQGGEASPDAFAAEGDARTKVASARKVSAILVLPEGVAAVTEFNFEKDEIFIGRGKDCDLVLNDKKSSRKNSAIRRVGAEFIIRDLESANGTYVNGTKITEFALSSGDIIKIGAVEFVFQAQSLEYVAKEKDLNSLAADLASNNGAAEGVEPLGIDLPPDLNQFGMQAPGPETVDVPPLDASGSALFPASQNIASAGQASPVSLDLGSMSGTGDLHKGSGITGIDGAGAGKKTSLLEKFRARPKQSQAIWVVVVLGLLYFGLFDDDSDVKQARIVKKVPAKTAGVVAGSPDKTAADKSPLTFERLTPEQKRFVEAQHALAFDYYKNKDFDKAIFEVQKIFALVSDYKESREIERYAKEGKRKLEAIEEEKRKKEEEARMKARVDQLVEETRKLMADKNYEGARDKFAEVLTLDPDNPAVEGWKKEIEAYEEKIRLAKEQQEVQAEINKHAWETYREGVALQKASKFHNAIGAFNRAIQVEASDHRVSADARARIKECKASIQAKRDPILAEAKQAEEGGDLPKAFELYHSATVIDPPHPEGYAGMNRIRQVLHEKAKAIYTEAVISESYSDFSTARKKFKECLDTAPKDDIYYERSQRKLSHYFRKEDQPS